MIESMWIHKNLLSEEAKQAMIKLGLYKYYQVDSDNYPSIRKARVNGNILTCEFLQLDGWTKEVEYTIE